MRKHSFLIWFSHCSLLLIPLISFAGSISPGPVSGVWDASGNPYLIQGSIYVEPEQTLLIKPGVIVYIETPDTISIYGTLIAQGLPDDSIYFIGTGEQPWGGIKIYGPSGSSTILDYVSIQTPEWGIYSQSAQPSILHCTIKAHSVGVYALFSNLILSNSTISATAEQADALRLQSSDPTIEKCDVQVISTSPDYYVTAIRAEDSNPQVQYCTFNVWGMGISYGLYMEHGPRAEFSYSSFVISSTSPAYGAIISNSANPDFINNTFAVSSPQSVDRVMYIFNSSDPYIENCILYGDGGSEGINAGGNCTPVIVYTDVFNNSTNLIGCDYGVGCISRDPLFVEPQIRNYSLTQHSPCIDAGNPASPLDPDQTRADMGYVYFPHPDGFHPQNSGSPEAFGIITAHPNPFNSSSRLDFFLPARVQGELAIYNSTGQRISLIKQGWFDEGFNQFSWNAIQTGSGIYYAILSTDNGKRVRSLCLIK